MHSLNIVDDLVKFIGDSLSYMELQTKDETITKAPTVYDGYLPPKQNRRRGGEDTEQEDYPFVIVRYLGETDEIHEKNRIRFRLLIGTYSKDEQHGWRDTLSVMNRIKFALKEQQVIGPVNLTGKIDSALFEEQMRPTWHGIMEVEFEAPQIQWNRSVWEDE
ncbi:hypothetical protein SporoP37_15855 [Sporosarcina sp. P37]|uniref:hypothetical protein n=1 Tax=unclassified Sporosarcina TaxID=2647733 RepID=UPI000A17AA40|nr:MULTISPECIES: hypothetical protein [unclassified Sporosarcina]ARK26001.1 hypothetical protein SporoP37_15855 [Sporosarcina sp. P37]PID19369.1 hypothetical protein CSV62_02375 [Sporosarcina sp. P35]